MKKVLFLVLSFSFSVSGLAYDFNQMGRTEEGYRKCKIEMNDDEVTLYEYSPGTFMGRHKVIAKINLKDLSSERIEYRSQDNQKFIHYYLEEKFPMLKQYTMLYLYLNEDNTLDRFLAAKKHVPLLGRTTTEAVSCLFRY